MKDNNKELRKLLLRLNISSYMNGFDYIIEAVELIKKQQIHTDIMTIYTQLAKTNNTTYTAVERAIRHAIAKSYKTSSLNSIYCKVPNNASFLYDLVFNFDIMKEMIFNESK